MFIPCDMTYDDMKRTLGGGASHINRTFTYMSSG